MGFRIQESGFGMCGELCVDGPSVRLAVGATFLTPESRIRERSEHDGCS